LGVLRVCEGKGSKRETLELELRGNKKGGRAEGLSIPIFERRSSDNKLDEELGRQESVVQEERGDRIRLRRDRGSYQRNASNYRQRAR